MKRNKIIKSFNHGKQIEHKQHIAFHEAGHAMAIHLNNKARNLPPIFFQIMFKDLNGESEKELSDYQATHDNCVASVEGGRLIELLPLSIDALVHKTPEHNDAMVPLKRTSLICLSVHWLKLNIFILPMVNHLIIS